MDTEPTSKHKRWIGGGAKEERAFEGESEGLTVGPPVDLVAEYLTVCRNGKAKTVPPEGTWQVQPLIEGDQFRTYCVSGRHNEETFLWCYCWGWEVNRNWHNPASALRLKSTFQTKREFSYDNGFVMFASSFSLNEALSVIKMEIEVYMFIVFSTERQRQWKENLPYSKNHQVRDTKRN